MTTPVYPFAENDELWASTLNRIVETVGIQCTSSTRPADADRVDGTVIFETDTRRFYICEGNGTPATWVRMFVPVTDSTFLGDGTSLDNLRWNADFALAALPPDPATTTDWLIVIEDPTGTPNPKRLDATVYRGTWGATRPTANYTLVLADIGREIEMNVASANTVTFPQDSSVAIPVGSTGTILQYGAGQTTLVAGTGATIVKASPATLVMTGQWALVTWKKITANTFHVSGDLV